MLLLILINMNLIRTFKAVKREFLPSKEGMMAVKKYVDFYGKFVKADDLCFDVGANIGNRVGPLLRLGAKVVAVEPQKKYHRMLKYKYGCKICY
jgi:hypothetical protein